MKKRFLALMLAAAIIFTSLISLSSCGKKYKPVESTKEERATVINISYDGEKYEVPYEIYRAFFLQYKSSVDGGDASVWTGPDKAKYEREIDIIICQRISEIYAVFHLCEKAGINVYSKSFDKDVQKNIEVAVEGGTLNGINYVGFGGDYDKYLASLKEMNLNYSASEFLIRYQLARQSLIEYYVGDFNAENFNNESQPGKIQYTKEDVSNFYFDPTQSRTIMTAELPEHFTEEEAKDIKLGLLAILSNPEKTLTDVKIYIANRTFGNPESEVIGKYTYDKLYYDDLTKASFSIDVNAVSDPLLLRTSDYGGYTLVLRLDTSSSYFEENYGNIAASYILNKFGEIVENTATNIMSSMSPTKTLEELDRSKVSMN